MKLALETPLDSSDDENEFEDRFVSLSDDEETVERKQRLTKQKYTTRGKRKYPRRK